MSIRDRVVELRRIPAKDLLANPANWRRHPDEQRHALAGLLDEIGFADVAIGRDLGKKGIVLLDGHLRQDLVDPSDEIPVVIVDLNDREAELLLTTLDPIAGMANTDPVALTALLDELSVADEALSAFLDDLRAEAEEVLAGLDDGPAGITNHPTLADYGAGYRSKAIRSVILDYHGDFYLWVVDRLRDLRDRFGVVSNAEAVFELLASEFPDDPPPEDPGE